MAGVEADPGKLVQDLHTLQGGPQLDCAHRRPCREGFLALRFNFPCKEKGRKPPDSRKKLVNTWRCVYRYLKDHPEFTVEKVVVAGKSIKRR